MLFLCIVVVSLCCLLWAEGPVRHKFAGRRGMQAAREFRKRAHLTEGICVSVFWACVCVPRVLEMYQGGSSNCGDVCGCPWACVCVGVGVVPGWLFCQFYTKMLHICANRLNIVRSWYKMGTHSFEFRINHIQTACI